MAEHLHHCDVLILGAGLAGLRAAWAAAEAAPTARVVVAAMADRPSGSSFANIHNTLGMQVLADDEAKADFTDHVLDVAAPGFVDASLVRTLAEDSLHRFWDLTRLGVPLLTDGRGEPRLQPACFARHARRCVVLADMAATHALMRRRAEELGVSFVTGRVLELVRDETRGRVCGALLDGPGGPRPVAAGAVVMALGGPASLFAWSMAGPLNTGTSHALLARAGAELVNEGWMQFMWTDLATGRGWPVWKIGRRDMQVVEPDGLPRHLPTDLAALAGPRAEHWPVAHDRPDATLDAFLMANAGADGVVELVDRDASTLRLVLMAHAGNGGARIDGHGRTSVPGLFAAGECASGMHGANRLGGAMVLATQVFGTRAGRTAALEADGRCKDVPVTTRMALAEALLRRLDRTGRAQSRHERPAPPVSKDMHRQVVPAGGPDTGPVLAALERARLQAAGTDRELSLEGACLLVRFLRRAAVYGTDEGLAAARPPEHACAS